MEKIQNIPTKYNGVNFRSRLEARWAVFFDTLGIQYFYEYEGFQLPSGWYLPDFWLPEFKKWIEIKPKQRWEDRQQWRIDMQKIKELAIVTGYTSIIQHGGLVAPRSNVDDSLWVSTSIAFADGRSDTENIVYTDYWWGECPKCQKIYFGTGGYPMCGCDLSVLAEFDEDGNGFLDPVHFTTTPRMLQAYSYANKLRFY
jgi:hypothetical protein